MLFRSVIDHFLDVFSAYIDSGFGLLSGEVAYLTATLVAIDMTLAGLYWSLGHAAGQGEDVIAKLLRKVLYVGAFAYIIGNFNWLAGIVFHSFAGLGLMASGSTLSLETFLQPGHLAKTGIDAGAPILEQINDMAGFPEVFVNLTPIVVMFLAWLTVIVCFFVLAVQLFVTLIEFKLVTLAGFVTNPWPYYAAADAFLLTSHWEGMPNAVLEAMASGLPCVCTDVEGVRELIEDGRTGFVVPRESPEAMQNALAEIFTQSERSQKLATAAQAFVNKDYTWESIVKKYDSLYRDLLADSHEFPD